MHRVAHSYRQDPTVPEFDDGFPIVFMDGDCVLCTVTARLIIRFDRAGEFRICPVQTVTGRAVLNHYGLDPDVPESWLYLVDGKAYESLDAMIRAGARLGGVGWLLQPLRLLPRPVQDWLYRRIARNRIRFFGRTDMCALPDPALRSRLME
jgi:predicted DCC family thiol-disulfide oxidoreductase YuxK